MTNKSFLMISWISSITILIIFISTPLHPIHMMILLLIYNIWICLNMSMWKATFLPSILFFLIMISGLMILFLYFSSLISNEKTWINIDKNSMIFMNLMAYIIFFMMVFATPLTPLPAHLDSSPTPFIPLISKNSFMAPLFGPPLIPVTMLNMIYLLLALLLIMKMCAPKIKPMRKLN